MSSIVWPQLLLRAAIFFVSGFSFQAAAADFVGGNLGAIPDNDPVGRDITFPVNGMSAAVADVSVSLTMTHAFVRDLRVELISPGGIARRVVFARTGFNGLGGTSDLDGTYAFNDHASSDWWGAAATANGAVIAGGTYRSSTAGNPSGSIKVGGCSSRLSFAFDQLGVAQINGTWTLHVADVQGGDTGAVSAAKLSLLSTADALFADGFDSPALGSCVRAQFDYTGSNRSSYVVVRNTGGGPSGAITWFIRDNDGTATGAERSYLLGNAGDVFLGGDFDGDGIWDPAVWTSGAIGHFKVLLSSRPGGPLLQFDFGKTGDDPTQVGDFDGDGKTDFALYRAGANAGNPSFTLIHPSGGGPDRTLATGANGFFATGGSDYSGDGFADLVLQSNAGGGMAHIDIYSGVNGALLDTFQFGTPTDIIVPGNHSGDARADVTTIRGNMGAIDWTTHESGTGTVQPVVTFGATATDFPLSGDFDGDGLDDYAVFRPNIDPLQTIFTFRPSSDPGTPISVNFGKNGDYPVENSRAN